MQYTTLKRICIVLYSSVRHHRRVTSGVNTTDSAAAMELRDPLGLAASSAAVAVALEEEPAAPPTLCCCCCRDRCPDTHGIRQATYEVMTTGALEGSLSAGGSERRWTFFAGTVVEVLVLFVIVVNCIYVLVDAETTVVAEQDGSAVGSAFVRAFALAAAWASRAVPMFNMRCSTHHAGFTRYALSQHPRNAGELSASCVCSGR